MWILGALIWFDGFAIYLAAHNIAIRTVFLFRHDRRIWKICLTTVCFGLHSLVVCLLAHKFDHDET